MKLSYQIRFSNRKLIKELAFHLNNLFSSFIIFLSIYMKLKIFETSLAIGLLFSFRNAFYYIHFFKSNLINVFELANINFLHSKVNFSSPSSCPHFQLVVKQSKPRWKKHLWKKTKNVLRTLNSVYNGFTYTIPVYSLYARVKRV